LIEIGTIIAAVGLAISVATFFIGRVTAGKSSGKENGQLLSDLGYIKSSVDSLRTDVKELNKNHGDIRIEQAAQARDIKTLYSRVEKVEERIAHYHES
jgi:peptidoglycan hydrolase CwlO-like protein